MNDNHEYALGEIDNLIRINKETIENLKYSRERSHYIENTIAINKSITRVTEHIRKLLRIRISLSKDSKNNDKITEKPPETP